MVLSKGAKRILLLAGVLILIGALILVNRSVTLSPWVWAACLAVAGLGALALHLADRSDGLLLVAAYLLWVIAGLLALVPSGLLREEGAACYVLLAVALPFLAAFIRDRARWWALFPAYFLLVIVGAIGLAEFAGIGDDLVSAYLALAAGIPFLAIYARDRKQWWALLLGAVAVVLGLSFASWLPWTSVRASFMAGSTTAGASAQAPLAIGNGTVIDGTGAAPIPDGVVLVQGGRIVAVGRAADVALPPDALVLDAEGGAILPGLIDSHVHSAWSP